MRRWAKRLGVTLLALIVLLAIPIVWIESACTASRDPGATKPLSFPNEPGYARRPESDSYLSYPKSHVVYAYDDLAGVLRQGDESDFTSFRQIVGFWTSFCRLNRLVTAQSPVGFETKVRLYNTGVRFTAEFGLKGAYERTLGRLFEWFRGPSKTAEGRFVAQETQACATFIRRTPWYEYPFGSRLLAFWREMPWGGDRQLRKLERRAVVTVAYGTDTVFAVLSGLVSRAAAATSDATTHTIVLGLTGADVARDSRITVLRDLGAGRTLIRTPRHQLYTDLVVDLARRGRDITEIAGNDDILVTVLAPRTSLPALTGVREVFSAPIQSRPDRRRVGLDVSIVRLAATIRALERVGVSVERIYDY